jgi:hypothetical protein
VENQSKAEKERKKQKKEIRQVMWVVRSGRTRGQLSLKQILKSLRTKKQKTDKKGGKRTRRRRRRRWREETKKCICQLDSRVDRVSKVWLAGRRRLANFLRQNLSSVKRFLFVSWIINKANIASNDGLLDIIFHCKIRSWGIVADKRSVTSDGVDFKKENFAKTFWAFRKIANDLL